MQPLTPDSGFVDGSCLIDYGGSGGFSDSARGKQYEEYDAGEWEDSTARASSSTHRNPSSNQRTGGAPPKPMGMLAALFLEIILLMTISL